MKIFNWIKNNVSTCIYSLCGLITLGSTIGLVTWSIQGEQLGDVNIIEKEVITNEKTQIEYLVGQKVNTNELYLNIGTEDNPQLIKASDCEITSNFKSAGHKEVTLTYSVDKNNAYQGKMDVYVHFVRNIIINKMPNEIIANEENKTFSTDESFSISAEISSLPKTNYFTLEETNDDSIKIKLTNDMYSTSIAESVNIDNFYSANIYCGNLTYNFNFYNEANKTFLVDSEKDVVFFENLDSNSSASLKLVITERDDSYQTECVGQTKGYYVYVDDNNQKTVLDFNFELTETSENYSSKDVKETKNESEDYYLVEYLNNSFKVQTNLWQSAVVNGLIYNDQGYKLVADSNSRLLDLTYLDENNLGDNPTLKLYVSTYTFSSSTGSGISQGFYIYDDGTGKTYKFHFYLQTWTWDHVPLSVNHNDQGEVSISDYLTTQYSGSLVTEIRVFIRGKGTVTHKFTASFDEWRLVCYSMA